MGKIFKYKVHKVEKKEEGKVRRRVKEERRAKKNVRNKKVEVKPTEKKDYTKARKVLRIFTLFLIIFLFALWFYNAYVTLLSVKITDVIGNTDYIFNLVDEDRVKKTVIVYEDITEDEQINLFILVVLFNQDTSEILTYYYPNDLYLLEDFGSKFVSVANLTYAGNTYVYNDRYAFVLRQLSNYMAMDFDSYIWLESEMVSGFFSRNTNFENVERDVMNIFSRLSSSRLATNYYKSDIIESHLFSNMGFIEIFRYFQQINAIVDSKNYSFVDLGSDRMTNDVVLGSGQEVSALSVSAFDISLTNHYQMIMDRGLAREHVKVEIYNGSDIPMYAGRVARKIHNAGCNVVRFSNAPKTYEKNYIYIPNPDDYPNALEKILGYIQDPEIVYERPEFLTTGDIIVVLGN